MLLLRENSFFERGEKMSKTKKIIAGISTTAFAFGLTGCGNDTDIPPMPSNNACRDWEWDSDDGVWECDDENSSYFHHYYYGGSFYGTRSLLHKNKGFLNYKNSKSFKGGSNYKKGSSGFGSGSKSYGG
ncbi:MAG: aminotransferase yhxA [Bacillus sp. (in: firmicutes)]|jgi:hypothetical protein|nr:aminotransferase yhxA [Bacillus sp. (in: firmicutes)]